ncbi:hypothetical protein BDK51DRAFT_31925 [Blyttiomyces helicus]|uniref:Uncharacterized protein n=1 Tax=Blyttiomyces helicus TaxID=388810 RepID=A0A4P9VYD4_9FUNG|nr:hypothetical protein BDK51DRAFT_31925 [Blyttiomyces helicus]|eukprot:RKO84791.1 hypothetical protein BDK51DRAFT_31925 [Blyttiomyces helicus]
MVKADQYSNGNAAPNSFAASNKLTNTGVLIVLGSFLVLSSLLGCCGSCFRSNGILNAYISFIVLTLVVVLARGIFVLVKNYQRRNNWNNFTEVDWVASTDDIKDYLQSLRIAVFEQPQSISVVFANDAFGVFSNLQGQWRAATDVAHFATGRGVGGICTTVTPGVKAV